MGLFEFKENVSDAGSRRGKPEVFVHGDRLIEAEQTAQEDTNAILCI
jgi:hypothetical protein